MPASQVSLPVDPASEVPMFLQIVRGLEQAILDGRLKPGDPLPGTRALAEQLHVSRNTVIAAFQELIAEGWIEAHGAAGSFVSRTLPQRGRQRAKRAVPNVDQPSFAVNPAPPVVDVRPVSDDVLSCFTGEGDPRQLPVAALSRAYRHAATSGAFRDVLREHPQGLERLRRALGEMLSSAKGRKADAAAILVTSGVKETLGLLCRALLHPGDAVGLEALSSPSHREVLALAGARLEPLPLDDDGLSLQGLEQRIDETGIRMLVITPVRQYPTTVTLAASRRRALLAICRERHLPVIEIDLDPGFHYEGPPQLPLISEPGSEEVIYLGAFSKLLFNTLPVAYLCGPATLMTELGRWREATAPSVDPLLQCALAELMEDGEIQRHLQRVRKLSIERRDAMMEALVSHLGGVLDPHLPLGGLAFWAKVADAKVDVSGWSRRALQRGVAFRPGRDFTFDDKPIPYLRVGFGSLSVPELREAVRRMAQAL